MYITFLRLAAVVVNSFYSHHETHHFVRCKSLGTIKRLLRLLLNFIRLSRCVRVLGMRTTNQRPKVLRQCKYYFTNQTVNAVVLGRIVVMRCADR